MKLTRSKSRKVGDPSENGSLSDLAFLLIIYFIVIAGFNVNQGFLLNLPEKDKPKIVQQQDLIKIDLDADGNIYLGDELLTENKLNIVISENLQLEPNMTLLLTIDPNAKYQEVIDVIYIIRNQNVHNFSFRMKETNGV